MTTNTLAPRRTFYDAVVGDLVELIKAQPHQVLISSASVAIVASEAAALIPAPFNVLMAAGAEWAYLRGIASSGRGARGWVTALNWGALVLVVLYGMLWGARKFGALPVEPAGFGAWALTAAHILPVAFLSLAAAMVHRSAVEDEEREAAEERAWRKELERKAAERRLDVDTRVYARQQLNAAPVMRPASDAPNARPARINAEPQPQVCPACGAAIEERAKYLAAKRWGRCAACKEAPDAR